MSKPTKPYPTPEALAKAFGDEIRASIAPDDLKEVNRLNAKEPDRPKYSICHSHDYCDANDAMFDAWLKLGQLESDWDPASQEQADLWNEAWTIAKVAGFKPPE